MPRSSQTPPPGSAHYRLLALLDRYSDPQEKLDGYLAEQVEVRREAAREAAVAKLNSIYSGQIPERAAREIADAALAALTEGGAR
ncbi:hypothetical protein [Streptomyces rochei]